MAAAIASRLHEKAQRLHHDVLALRIVIDLYMTSSSKNNIDDMIFIVDHLYSPIAELADELQSLVREAAK